MDHSSNPSAIAEQLEHSSDFLNHGMIPYFVLGKNIILTHGIKLYEFRTLSKAILPYSTQ
jgi:hypothetical protein